jgi:PAS domain S-box-containing protein
MDFSPDSAILIEQCPFAIGIVAPDGTMLKVSPAWSKLLGFDPTGQRYQTFTHPDDIDDDVKQHQRLVSGETSSYNMIKRYRHADGRWIHVLLEVGFLPGSEHAIAYVSDISKDIQQRQQLDLQGQISTGILNREFELHYQPVVKLEDCTVVGYEGLIRWRQKNRLLYPGDFLEGLSTATMELLTFEVLRIAIDDIPRLEPYWVAVNLDPRTLKDKVFGAKLLAFLSVACINPVALRLEVTEQYLIELTLIEDTLQRAADLGHIIELDDVGSGGYSNLSLIAQEFFKAIKIDKALTDKLFCSADGKRIQKLFRTLLSLADSIGLEVIVEGVEIAQQHEWLWANGFQYGQGWLFGKAEPLQ